MRNVLQLSLRTRRYQVSFLMERTHALDEPIADRMANHQANHSFGAFVSCSIRSVAIVRFPPFRSAPNGIVERFICSRRVHLPELGGRPKTRRSRANELINE